MQRPVIDLSKLPRPRMAPKEAYQAMRRAQAEQQRRRSEELAAQVEPVVGGMTLYSDSVFDEFGMGDLASDPCLKGVVALGEGGASKSMHDDSESDDEDVGQWKRKHAEDAIDVTFKRKPTVRNDSSDDEADYSLASLKRHKPNPTNTNPSDVTLKEGKGATKTMLKPLSMKKNSATISSKVPSNVMNEIDASMVKSASGKIVNESEKLAKEKAPISSNHSQTKSRRHKQATVSNDAMEGQAVTIPSTPDLTIDEEDRSGPMNGLDPEESALLKLLHRDINLAEENGLMDQLGHEIDLAEEQHLLASLGEEIAVAERRGWAPSGMVIAEKNFTGPVPEHVLDLEREWDQYESVQAIGSRFRCLNDLLLDSQLERRKGVLDMKYMGTGENYLMKEFPKYIGDRSELLLSRGDIATILDKVRKVGSIESLNFNVMDKVGDRQTIIVEMRGPEEVIERLKTNITFVIRAKQLRFLRLTKTNTSVKPVETTRRGNQSQKQYQMYVKRFQRLRQIEFPRDIHAKTIESSMWKVHKTKEIVGKAVCSSVCPCFTKLGALTAAVVKDVVKKKRKKKPDYPEPLVTGFAGRFVPKFMPLLKKKFPLKTNEEILSILERMWLQHMKQHRFGSTCKEDCPCLEGWVRVFEEGELRDTKVNDSNSRVARTGLAGQKESLKPSIFDTTSQNVSVSGSAGKGQTDSVFSSRGASVSAVPGVASNGTNESSPSTNPKQVFRGDAAHSNGEANKKACMETSLKKLNRGLSSSQTQDNARKLNENMMLIANMIHDPDRTHQKPYEIAFDANKQLGFFVATKEKKWSEEQTKCNIVSVNSIGIAKDSRLHPGTIILSASRDDSGTWENIHTWEDLEKEYNSSESKIRIRFINTEVKAPTRSLRDTDFWTSMDTCKRPMTSGWAGGAKFVGARATKRLSHNQSLGSGRTTSNQGNQLFNPVSRSQSVTLPPSTSDFAPGKWLERGEPKHRLAMKPKSIFKKKSGVSVTKTDSLFRSLAGESKRGIKWNKHLKEERIFDPEGWRVELVRRNVPIDSTHSVQLDVTQTDHAQFEHADAILDQAAKRMSKLPSEEELLKAIRDKSCLDLYDLLNAGAVVEKGEQPLIEATQIVRGFKETVENNRETSASTQDAFDEATAKLKLMKVFEKFQKVVKDAKFYKQWGIYELKIVRIENVKVTDNARWNLGDLFECEFLIKDAPIKTKPMELSEVIEYPEGAGTSSRSMFYYNAPLESDKTLVMKFRKVTRNSVEPLTELAEESRTMSEVVRNVTKANGNKSTFTIEFKQTFRLRSAKAIVTVRKFPDDKKKISKTRASCQAILTTLLDDISSYNKDSRRGRFNLPVIDVNLRNPLVPEMNLLHAAVNLYDTKNLRTLKDLGGKIDDKGNGKQRSPRQLALQSVSNDEDERRMAREVEELLDKWPRDEIIRDVEVPENVDEKDVGDSEASSIVVHPGTYASRQNTDLAILQDTDNTPPNLSRNVTHDGQMMTFNAKQEDEETQDEIAVNHKRDHMADHPPHSRKMARVELVVDPYLLPSLTFEQLLNGKMKCQYHPRCHRRSNCRYAHWDDILLDDNNEIQAVPEYDVNELNVQERMDVSDQLRYTAAYRDKQTNTYLAAAGYNTIGKNRNGIYWYSNLEDATCAMEQVIASWQKQNSSKSPNDGQKTHHSLSAKDEEQWFSKLQRANLSNLFAFVVQRRLRQEPLRKDDWTRTISPSGWFHMSFRKWISPQYPSMTFKSGSHGDARREGNLWFHPDEASAKASAFLEFLAFLLRIGMLMSMNLTIDGRRIVYKK